MERRTIPLAQLIVNPAINPRHASDDDVSDLVAQIEANGFTDALWVREVHGTGGMTYEIIDGSRRFRALCLRANALGVNYHLVDVPVDVMEADDAHAQELALAANVARSDLSPADEAIAFYRLKLNSMSVENIAARFGVTKKLVRQRIAIGSLPAPILDALRADVIDLDVAEAFTLTTSAERQLEVFGAGKNLSEWGVRRALTTSTLPDDDYRFKFVGYEAYAQAGGVINEDLFGTTSYITDVPLLQSLYDDKIKTTIQGFKDAGWKWVKVLEGSACWSHRFVAQPPRGKRQESEEQKATRARLVEQLKVLQKEFDVLERMVADDATATQGERYQELPDLIESLEEQIHALQSKPYTQKQMGQLGVLIKAQMPVVSFEYGYELPEDAKKQAKDKTPDPDEAFDDDVTPAQAGAAAAEAAGYSDAVEILLLNVARNATKLAMCGKPAIAARLGLAARVCEFLDKTRPNDSEDEYTDLTPPFSTARTSSEDQGKLYMCQQAVVIVFDGCTSFIDVAARLETLTPDTIIQIEAVMAASLLLVTALKNTDAQALIDLVDPDMRANGFAPDAEFLKGLSRDQLALISAEIDSDNPIKKAKKPDMVAAILPLIETSGWLPPQLRTPSYTGPGSDTYEPSPLAGEGGAQAPDEGLDETLESEAA